MRGRERGHGSLMRELGVQALFSPRVPGSFRRAEEELTLGKRAITDSACLVLASYLRQYCDANLSK